MILFVGGINDSQMIGVTLNDRGQMLEVMDGNCSVFDRLQLGKGIAATFFIFPHGVQQRMPGFSKEPSLIFNQIADADTHRQSLERCVELCDHLKTPVINHPRQVIETTREQVSDKLQGIPGVVVPRTLRFQPRSPQEVLEYATEKEIAFPYIARVAGFHNGESLVKLDRAEDAPALNALPFDGRDFYLIEYIDYRDEQGLYHKQRIVVLDGEPFLRHALYFDQWMVHAQSREFMMQRDSWDDDIERFDQLSEVVLPGFRPAIDEITRRLGLEYYGIDCSLSSNGQLIVFEANANMNVLYSPNPNTRYRVEPIEKKLYAMLSSYSGMHVVKSDTASIV